MLHGCYSQLVDKLLEQLVTRSVELSNLVAVDNLSTSWEQAVRTHPVDKLLENHCYRSAAGLLQLVRFYVCAMVFLSSNQRERLQGGYTTSSMNLKNSLIIHEENTEKS